jgi:hypothetical protein
MTDKQALKIYFKVFPEAAPVEECGGPSGIADEMRRVAEARTLADARKVIEWWGCWDGERNPERALTRDVKAIRSMAKGVRP